MILLQSIRSDVEHDYINFRKCCTREKEKKKGGLIADVAVGLKRPLFHRAAVVTGTVVDTAGITSAV